MKKMSFKLLLIFALFLFSIVALTATELARIGNKVITLEEFNKKYKENLKYFRFKAPTKKNILDEIVKREVAILEAKKEGIDKDPEVIERINTVLYHSLIDKKLSKQFEKIEVTDKEVEEYYKKNPEIRTSHIFVQVRFDANEAQVKAAREKIEKIKKELDKALKEGKTFAEVARMYSEGIAAATGGDIDYQTKDKLDPVYYETAKSLKVGEISDIVRSQFGFHIIKLTAIKDFKDVDKGMYKRILFDEKRQAIYDKYMDELVKKYQVKINTQLLN
jgi:peptidyl-prolyl cis-trans isomerase C/peptidyl-prolyl cis-trans isomerase D